MARYTGSVASWLVADAYHYVDTDGGSASGELRQVTDVDRIGGHVQQLAGVDIEEVVVRSEVAVIDHSVWVNHQLTYQAFAGQQSECVIDGRLGDTVVVTIGVDLRQDLFGAEVLIVGQQHAGDVHPLAGRKDAVLFEQ